MDEKRKRKWEEFGDEMEKDGRGKQKLFFGAIKTLRREKTNRK